jgi:hypothetical protein
MNDQIYFESAYGTIPVTVLSVYRDASTNTLMAEIMIDEDFYPYDRTDRLKVVYDTLVHFDR